MITDLTASRNINQNIINWNYENKESWTSTEPNSYTDFKFQLASRFSYTPDLDIDFDYLGIEISAKSLAILRACFIRICFVSFTAFVILGLVFLSFYIQTICRIYRSSASH